MQYHTLNNKQQNKALHIIKNLLNSSLTIHNYKIIFSHMLKQETSADKM
jgi:hypothetical protein